jgi:hypothetical protein
MSDLRVIGLFLAVALIAWIAISMLAPVGYHADPNILGLGSAFEGNLQLSSEKITEVFEEARKQMVEVNSRGSWLRTVGDVAGWLSFAATASITLIAGFYGRAPGANGAATDTSGLPARSVRMIAFLAALAAVLTAFGSLAIAKSQDYFKKADEVRDLIVHNRAEIIDAKTPDAAQAILDDLVLQISR